MSKKRAAPQGDAAAHGNAESPKKEPPYGRCGAPTATGKPCRAPATKEGRCVRHTARALAEGPHRRCTARARSRDGERCRRPAIPGGSVCVIHGGATPSVKQKAALRLAALVDPAIATLAREMVSRDNKSADRQRAANSILDRAGIVRQSSGELDTAKALLIERLRALREQKLGIETPPELDVLDAEVIDG